MKRTLYAEGVIFTAGVVWRSPDILGVFVTLRPVFTRAALGELPADVGSRTFVI